MENTDAIPLPERVNQLADMKLSLAEVMGKDWKEKVVFPTIEAALKEEGIQSLSDGQEVIPGEEKTDLDKFIVEANTIFERNGSSHHATRITTQQGVPEVLVVGQIGKDTFYQTAQYTKISTTPNGQNYITLLPDTIGIVSEGGQVLRTDKIVQLGQNPNEQNDIVFAEISGEKYEDNLSVLQGNTNDILHNDVITALPDNYKGLGIYLHELGHMLRRRAIIRDVPLRDASLYSSKEFQLIKETGSPFNSNSEITPYQTRLIKTRDERGAWAIGLSLLKDVGQSIGLDCASPQAVNEITKVAESCLQTYDNLPYTFIKHDETQPIPAFSQEKRTQAQDLHKQMLKKGQQYSDLPSFDPNTRENIANDPQKVLDKLNKTNPV